MAPLFVATPRKEFDDAADVSKNLTSISHKSRAGAVQVAQVSTCAVLILGSSEQSTC